MTRATSRAAAIITIVLASATSILGCSNIMVPSGSSKDGTTIISYTADDAALFGDLSHWPAATHADGELREIYSWDFGTRLGAIPQPKETYNVVGNTNEHQLSIGETTFGGLSVLDGTEGKAVCHEEYGCIDYGQLIWVTLARAKTAREAIATMANLTNTYGYASEGESFSIADPNEVWLLELIGKGGLELGSVWVATRIQDGYVCAHANQARTRTFPRDTPDEVLFAPDVVSFAQANGLWSPTTSSSSPNAKDDGDDSSFDFSDVYDPVSFEGARFCDARVWSVFLQVADPSEGMESYLDYAQGYNLTHRLPLAVKVDPSKLLSVNDTFWLMRNHFEHTWLDPSQDVGSGLDASPYRLGAGLTWAYQGSEYVNERFIGTQKAAWNFVANQRKEQLFSVLWFGVDDSTFSVKTPIYGAASKVPASYDGGDCTGRSACRRALGLPGTITDYSIDSIHWIVNQVANFAYSRYALVGPAVQAAMAKLEAKNFGAVASMDAKLLAMQRQGNGTATLDQAKLAATEFSFSTAAEVHARWVSLFGEVFSKYVDGCVLVEAPSEETCGCGKVTPGFSDQEKARIVSDTGDHYKVPAAAGKLLGGDPKGSRKTRSKLALVDK